MPDYSKPPHILIVEDDPIVREIVASYLRSEGLVATETADIASAVAIFSARPVDLVIVDINLPDGLGFDLITTLRRQRDCAAIYMTSRGGSDDRVRGLETGGDDYVVKPIDVRELLARVRAVLRRYRGGRDAIQAPGAVMAFRGWTLDLLRRELADPCGQLIRLTRAEFDLFAALAQAGATPLSREYLLEVVSSADSTTKERTIDVMISRIRRKLGAAAPPTPQILTRQGQGYCFQAPPP